MEESKGNTSEVKAQKPRCNWSVTTNRGGTRALESARWATLLIPDHAIQVGNRPVPETEPASGLQSRRPSRGWKIVSYLPRSAESGAK